NTQEAAITPPAPTPSTPAPTNLASAAINTAPLPGTPPEPATTQLPSAASTGSGVSVDYSVLNGTSAPSSFQPAAPVAPMSAAIATSVAGVGQAVGYVYFGNGSSALSSADREVLRQVVALQRIQGGVLRIVGHASQRTGNLDAMAQDQVNQKVS